MTLKEQLNEELRAALRSGDDTRKTTIRLLLSAVHNAEIQAGKPLDDAGILGVVTREVKQRRESIEEYRKGNRPDLVAKEEAEMAVLSTYMPPQMSTAEIEEAARQVIEQVGARGPADKGKVMPVIMGQLRGKADGSEINRIVTDLLSRAQA